MFICMQKINLMFLGYCKEITNLLFWRFWECLTIPLKIIVSICRKLSCLSACKKLISSLTFFIRYCKEIANLLFWLFGHTWSHKPKMIAWICKNLWCLSAVEKSTSSFTFSLRYCKDIATLLFLATSSMPSYTNPKWYYNLKENFCVYKQAKNQLHQPYFSGDIAKICKLLILDT